MSRIGNRRIAIPAGVSLDIKDTQVAVKGSKGELVVDLIPEIQVAVEGDEVVVTRNSEAKKIREMHGTVNSLIENAMIGVSQGYSKELIIEGVGYRAQMQGNKLVMQLGFSHDVELQAPEGVQIETPSQTNVKVSGINKQLVGQVSARIRGFSPAEPYKGKGVRYSDERIRRKAGKTVA